MEYHYDNLLERLNLPTLHNMHRNFDDLFLKMFLMSLNVVPLPSK
jgi:hypothetical protein